MRCIIVGTPNCGKSTLFNRLTKGRQRVGNWHGKTAGCKEGGCAAGRKEMLLVDLPGAYSMTPFSAEERAAIGAIQCGKFDAVLQVADACRLERSLFFTLALGAAAYYVLFARVAAFIAYNAWLILGF